MSNIDMRMQHAKQECIMDQNTYQNNAKQQSANQTRQKEIQ